MQQLVEHVLKLHSDSRARLMIGIVGYPGAGKSTLADKLVRGINGQCAGEVSIVVPMDGFHLRNAILEQRNLRPLKGVPETFDAGGFVKLLKKIRSADGSAVGCPAFDRQYDEPTENAITVEPSHRIVIVEGNYLLLPSEPWCQLKAVFDETWFIDSDFKTIEPRLLERHMAGGRTTDGARQKMESTDLPNARLIESTRGLATRVIAVDQDVACFSEASIA